MLIWLYGITALITFNEKQRAIQISGFDEKMIRRHDIDLWLRIIDGGKWMFDPVASTAYRKSNPNSLSSNQASAALFRLIAFIKNRETAKNSSTYNSFVIAVIIAYALLHVTISFYAWLSLN